jgi:hypothetical protein
LSGTTRGTSPHGKLLGGHSARSEELCLKGGALFVGLYHSHARRPFLNHFKNLKEDGNRAKREFDRLFASSYSKTYIESWYRDQVEHPHESQHTLRELRDCAENTNSFIEATSLTRGRPLLDVEAVIQSEPYWESYASQQLKLGRYFPGYFWTVIRRK